MSMRGLASLIIVCSCFLAACTPVQPAVIPSPIPTEPLPIETATPSPTRRPLPTPEPTAIQARTDAISSTEQSYLRVVHAAQELSLLDVYIQQLNIASAIEFGQITDPGGIAAGEFQLQIRPYGETEDVRPYIDETIQIEGEQSLILLIHGNTESPQYTFIDEHAEPLGPGLGRVRILNALPDNVNLDVSQNEQVFSTGLQPYQVSDSSTLATGPVSLNIVAGEINWEPYNFNLRERQQMTILITGSQTAPRILPLSVSAPGITQVRFINAAFNLLSVDVLLNASSIAQGISYGNSSERVEVPARFYTLTIRASDASADADPLLETDFAANPDSAMSIILVGEADNLQIITQIDDLSPIEPESVRISFLNTLPNLPRVNLSSSALIQESNYFYGQISQPETLLAGIYSMSWEAPAQEATNVDILEFVPNLALTAGRSYLYLMAGRGTDTPFVYSEDLEIIDDDPEIASTPGISPDQEPTKLRIINALPGIIADFSVAEASFSSAQNFGQSSPSVFISAGPLRVSASETASGTVIADEELELDFGREYALILYSGPFDNPEFFLLDETGLNMDPVAPSLRLINLTKSEREYALASSAASPQQNISGSENTEPAENPETTADTERLPSIPFGIDRVTTPVPPGAASLSLASTASIGLRDLYVIDVGQAGIALRLNSIQLDPGKRYDVVIVEDNNRNLQGFSVAYPQNTGP